jgi:murein DD-endopeptidase MepM/ murein hydrolase activator NlpD
MGIAAKCSHLGYLPLRSQPRVLVPAMIAVAVAGCSADSPRFDDPRFDATGAIGTQPAFDRTAGGYWSWDGGTGVTVGRGDTVYSIARRYHVPASVIIQANNLAAPNALRPGQHLVVPRLSTSPPPARPVSHPDVAALVPPESIPASSGGASIASGAEQRGATPEIKPAAIAPPAPKPRPALEPHPARLVEQPPPAKPPVVKPPAVKPPAVKPPEKQPGPEPAKGKAGEAREVGEAAAPRFHWPVRGTVISGFGLKADGERNDGIDIAVPEDTPIKAAHDGVVIYSGNQLKSFGNLVLVRHDNEYVTAYAHAKELRVKQGDAIKAGDVIGTSGQSGNVATPQVHFEIRKGSTPVDPMRLLPGA